MGHLLVSASAACVAQHTVSKIATTRTSLGPWEPCITQAPCATPTCRELPPRAARNQVAKIHRLLSWISQVAQNSWADWRARLSEVGSSKMLELRFAALSFTEVLQRAYLQGSKKGVCNKGGLKRQGSIDPTQLQTPLLQTPVGTPSIRARKLWELKTTDPEAWHSGSEPPLLQLPPALLSADPHLAVREQTVAGLGTSLPSWLEPTRWAPGSNNSKHLIQI